MDVKFFSVAKSECQVYFSSVEDVNESEHFLLMTDF